MHIITLLSRTTFSKHIFRLLLEMFFDDGMTHHRHGARCRASFDARPTFAPCSWSPQGRDCPAQRESSVYSSGNQTDRQSLLLLLLCFFLLLSPLDLLASMVALHMLLLTTPPCVHR